MAFSSPHIHRERILLYSEPGCGKSSAVISIAKILKATKSPSHVHVIDNDLSYQMMAESAKLDNLSVYPVYEFPEYIKSLRFIMTQLQPNDFLVCDLISEAWSAVQEYYTNQVFGDDIGSYFLKVRQDLNRSTEFDGWTDWKVINKLYFDFARPFVYKSPCHIIGAATADPIQRPRSGKSSAGKSSAGDDKETISIFGTVGYKPDGQKRLKHQFNTTIYLHKDARGRFLYTSVKDRERELQVSTPFQNFALDYLKGIAGWTL